MAFRDLILSNLRRKLFALLLAALIWTTIFFADKENRWWRHKDPQTNLMTLPR